MINVKPRLHYVQPGTGEGVDCRLPGLCKCLPECIGSYVGTYKRAVSLALCMVFVLASNSFNAASQVLYGHDPQEAADVYEAPGSANPAVVVIHGGGFIGGDKARRRYVRTCKDFVRHGITCFSINYRLLRLRDNTTLGSAQFVEVQLAMRWVRANAAKYGIDPTRVCAWGDSAGAYYAVLLGVTQATYRGNAVDDPFRDSQTLPEYSSRADCVVAIGVPADLGSLTNSVIVRLVSNLVSVSSLYAISPHSALEALSPLPRVNAHSAPMFIIQGDLDPYLPASTQAQGLVKALRSNGIPTQYVTYDGGHAFCLDSSIPCKRSMQAQKIKQILDKAAAWVGLTMKRTDFSRHKSPVH